MSRDTGGPAFPQPIVDTRGHSGIVSAIEMQIGGMTLRDYFAAAAMAASIGHPDSDATFTEFASYAYKMADAMLKERDK